MATPHTILISVQAWQQFVQNYPDAAQWLVLHLELPVFYLPSLSPKGEPTGLVITQEEALNAGASAG
jgi:hypothetical protein